MLGNVLYVAFRVIRQIPDHAPGFPSHFLISTLKLPNTYVNRLSDMVMVCDPHGAAKKLRSPSKLLKRRSATLRLRNAERQYCPMTSLRDNDKRKRRVGRNFCMSLHHGSLK